MLIRQWCNMNCLLIGNCYITRTGVHSVQYRQEIPAQAGIDCMCATWIVSPILAAAYLALVAGLVCLVGWVLVTTWIVALL